MPPPATMMSSGLTAGPCIAGSATSRTGSAEVIALVGPRSAVSWVGESGEELDDERGAGGEEASHADAPALCASQSCGPVRSAAPRPCQRTSCAPRCHGAERLRAAAAVYAELCTACSAAGVRDADGERDSAPAAQRGECDAAQPSAAASAFSTQRRSRLRVAAEPRPSSCYRISFLRRCRRNRSPTLQHARATLRTELVLAPLRAHAASGCDAVGEKETPSPLPAAELAMHIQKPRPRSVVTLSGSAADSTFSSAVRWSSRQKLRLACRLPRPRGVCHR